MTSAATELIVCAVDLTEEAGGVLEWATAFARRQGARVDLVHVVPEPVQDFEQLATDAARFEVERMHDATDAIQRLAARASGAPIHTEVLVGKAEERIVDYARRHAARAIVVGASSLLAVERWVLGSVAERTVRSAPCPVVVVPRSARGSSVDGVNHPLQLLVGLEGADGAAELVSFVADLRRRESCDVRFVHLYWPPEEYARLGLRGPRNPAAPDADVVSNLEPKLRPIIDGLPGQGRVSLDIHPVLGSPASNLLAAADEQACDLVIVGSHQRHGLARVRQGSVAESVARHATGIPVVCIPIKPARPGDRAGLPRVLTVLAPTDLSEVGNAAIPHAYGLLRGTGGVVELCHVNERGLPSPKYAYEPPQRLTKAERDDILKRLRALVPAEAEGLGITTHVSVIDGGEAAEAIVAAAERLNVDAVSLGSHGRGGLARAMLGSVAETVVRRARRPVLIVPGRRG